MEAGKSTDVQARAFLDAERMLEQRARLESIEQHESRKGHGECQYTVIVFVYRARRGSHEESKMPG